MNAFLVQTTVLGFIRKDKTFFISAADLLHLLNGAMAIDLLNTRKKVGQHKTEIILEFTRKKKINWMFLFQCKSFTKLSFQLEKKVLSDLGTV